MKKLLTLTICLGLSVIALAQPPQGFSYQAVLRNAEGQPLVEQNVNIRLTLQSENGSDVYYTETHTLPTSPHGVVSVAVGSGSGITGSLTDIPWEVGGVYLKVEVGPAGGTAYSLLGTTPLLAVPYALFAASGNEGPQGPEGPPGPEGPLVEGEDGQTLWHDGTKWVASSNIHNADANVGVGTVTPTEKLEVAGNIKAHGRFIGQGVEVIQPQPEEEPIFVVRNSKDEIVFAVYESGVRVYVDDSSKSSRGGFAVGGLSDQNKEVEGVHYLRVTPDSVRVNIKTPAAGEKSSRGGFAVGGLSDQNKEWVSRNLLFIAPDSARIYVDSSPSKQTRGGFAVGGLSDQNKGEASNFLFLTPENYFIGHKAGQANTEGLFNSFIGFESGFNNIDGSSNLFLGYKSGHSNIGSDAFVWTDPRGSNNVFLGNESGFSNTYGQNNIFIGNQSGFSNIGGYYNLFFGNKAGYSNTEGLTNIFIGERSGFTNLTGNSNIFIGESSGESNEIGSNNIFIGPFSGKRSYDSWYNVFVGVGSGSEITSGSQNVFIGNESGKNNTTGNYNTFVGAFSGPNNIESSQNVFVGTYSGRYNESGSGNVFIGHHSGSKNISGYGNTIIGSWSGWENTEGNGNVFLGRSAGYNETGSNKLYIHNNSLGPEWALIYGEFDNSKLRLNAEVNIRDFMVLEPRISPPSNPVEGTVYYDSSSKKIRAWDGEAWRDLW